jgi:EAL domain-containing protein (putative c-di-GMP-specific phosphodiesterase class I)
LYATSVVPEVRQAFADCLQALTIEAAEPFPGVFRYRCSAEQLTRLSAAWEKTFSASEQSLIQCRLVEDGEEPSIADLMHATPLGAVKAWVDGQWLRSLLADRRLVTYFQPIVNNSNPTDVFAYECLLRGIDHVGGMIMPGRILNAARATGTMQQVDQLAQLTAINTAQQINLKTAIFINFNPRFIDAPDYLRTTIDTIKQTDIDPSRFVFEVVESDEIVAIDRLMSVLQYCRDAGCRVALDDLGAGYSSLHLMAIVKPDFVKLDMNLIRNVDQDIYKSCVAAKLLELASELNVSTVVEGVESPGEWRWAIEHGADYAQGYLFARPDAVPPLPTQPPEPPRPQDQEALPGIVVADAFADPVNGLPTESY